MIICLDKVWDNQPYGKNKGDCRSTMKDKRHNKIIIIYHSGSGSTELISRVFSERLGGGNEVDIVKIKPDFDYNMLSSYDLVILGFPTYGFSPSFSAIEFVRNMPVMKDTAFFLFTTYGLYNGNSIRILSDMLQKKNSLVIGYMQIRGPASDGVLLFPLMKFFFRYEKKVNEKINRAVGKVESFLLHRENITNIPPLRWYSPLTRLFRRQLDRVDYRQYSSNLRVLEERCNNCNICVKNCIQGCWSEGEDHPYINPDNCEFCLKCVHNCPKKAIIFSDYMKDRLRLNKEFYRKIKESTFD